MIPIKTSDVRISSYYGQGKLIKDFHHGIDLVPKPFKGNEEILAFEDGVVTSLQKVGKQYGTGCYVRIKHDKDIYTLYYHLKSETICVNVGDKVKKGQKLGIIGTTGQSTGVHLHLAVASCNLYGPNCESLGHFFNFVRYQYNTGFYGLQSVRHVPYTWYNSR